MPKKSATSEPSNSLLPRLKTTIFLLRFLAVLLLGAVVVLLISLGVKSQPLELYVSYLPQLLLVGAAVHLVAATLVTRIVLVHSIADAIKRVGIVFSTMYAVAALLALIAGSISVFSFPPSVFSEALEKSDTLKVGTFNALFTSSNFAEDAGIIRGEGVDILALQEVDAVDVTYMQELLGYEYSFVTDCDCSAGTTEVGLVSKYPITRADTLYENENSTILRTEIELSPGNKIAVYAVHMFVPYITSAYAEREQAYDLLTDSIASDELSTIVMGDFNTTIFSPELRDFSAENKRLISDVTERFWPRCSWFGAGPAGCLRIDHIFAPIGASLHSIEVLESVESDHRPVLVELSLPTAQSRQLQ